MKTIDELGISPAPWFVQEYAYHANGEAVEGALKFVEDGEEGDLFSDDLTSIENARLISAVPEMYECLREAIVQTCLYCKYKKCEECKIVNKWKSALAKASGEESEEVAK